jgi:hypothetical protein
VFGKQIQQYLGIDPVEQKVTILYPILTETPISFHSLFIKGVLNIRDTNTAAEKILEVI